MTYDYIKQVASKILVKFRNSHPGQPLKAIMVLDPLRKEHVMDYHKAMNVYLMLLFGDVLKETERGWVELTENGYQILNEGNNLPMVIYLPYMLNLKQPKREQIFYDLWDIIGDGDKGTNPFYCSGSVFYDCIKDGLEGIPPTYSQYMKDLEAETGRKPSRSEWCKNLFMRLSNEQIEQFLKNLSDVLNDQQSEESDSSPVENSKEIAENKMKKAKIFISHNTEDKGYAAALVEMMHSYGVKYEDIFCSSHPACKIPFGKSILDAIATQFNEFELIVLFVHSPRLYQSPVSLNEMGAAWILKKECYSFLTKDCSFNDLKGVIDSKVIAFKAGQEDTYANLHDFEEMLYEEFGLEKQSGAAAEYIRTTFINAVGGLENK